MKIAHCIYCMGIGGAQTMLVDTLNEQSKNNEVHLIIINSYYSIELLDEIFPSVRIHKINRKQSSKNPLDILRFNFLLFNIKPDVIHSHDDSIIKLIVLKAFPICLTVHDTGLKGCYYSKYDKLIAISSSVQRDVESRYGYKSDIIFNGILLNRIRHKAERLDNGYFRIVQVSRLSLPKKGQDILIHALAALHERGLNKISLDLIGCGESENEIKNITKKLRIRDHVRFLGLKNRKYIYNNLCEYNLFVQPSRNEGFGLTVAEAMAAKLPVLVSNVEGPMEIIENGKFGFFFNNGDATDCANMIEHIYKKIKFTDIEENYQNIIQKYDISTLSRRYCEIYRELK